MTAVLVDETGTTIPLDVARWRKPPDAVERRLISSLVEPVLDVGCGPGRIVTALAMRGRAALGIDTSPSAVAEARRRGAPVLRRSIFDGLPGEGRWGSVVLLDGNIGIGGDPAALLRRTASLIRNDGSVLVELADPEAASQKLRVRVECDGVVSGPFPWATLGDDALLAAAAGAGLASAGAEMRGGRWFRWLRRS